MNRALFVDRDGVINRMVKYGSHWDSPQKPKDVRLIEGIEKLIGWANGQKIPVIEISNQPGVAKGKMSQKTSDEIELKVHRLLKQRGVSVNKSYICPHHPDAIVPELKKICNCRKPEPGLLIRASNELRIELADSIFIGDNDTDVQAAKNAGVKSMLFVHEEDESDKQAAIKHTKADFKINTMEDALSILKKYFKSV